MMARSTIAFSVSLGALILATTSPRELVICGVSALLPDVDMSRSYAGRALPWVAKWIEHRWAHRTITHSFAASFAIAILLWPLNLIDAGWVWRSVVAGYSLGWFSDTFTKAGVCAFFPAPHRLVMGKNPRYRLETGSRAESWIFGLLVIAAIASISLQLQGGIFTVFTNWLATPQGAVSAYEQVASTNRVELEIVRGFESASMSPISGDRFQVLRRLGGTELLVSDGELFYQAGVGGEAHLRMNRARVHVGEPVQLSVAEEFPSYVNAADVLRQYSEQEVYVTGRLELRGAFGLATAHSPLSFPVIRYQFSSPGEAVAILESCPIAMAIAGLDEMFVTTGELQFLIVEGGL